VNRKAGSSGTVRAARQENGDSEKSGKVRAVRREKGDSENSNLVGQWGIELVGQRTG
jgi:hypothetical protein